MQTEFLTAAQALLAATAQFKEKEISSVAFSRLREAAIAQALNALATEQGVRLEAPLQVDSRGEFRVVALQPKGGLCWPSTGTFGADFVKLINRHNPRTGIQAGATLLPESGWCYLNHFDAERLVLERYLFLKISG